MRERAESAQGQSWLQHLSKAVDPMTIENGDWFVIYIKEQSFNPHVCVNDHDIGHYKVSLPFCSGVWMFSEVV